MCRFVELNFKKKDRSGCSIGSVEELKPGDQWFESQAGPIALHDEKGRIPAILSRVPAYFYSILGDNHPDRILCSPTTANHLTNDDYAGKSQWFGNNILLRTGERNSGNTWIGALAAAI